MVRGEPNLNIPYEQKTTMKATQHTAWISYKYRDDYTKDKKNGTDVVQYILRVCVCVCERERERVCVALIFFNGMGCTHFFNIHNWVQIVFFCFSDGLDNHERGTQYIHSQSMQRELHS